MINKLRASIVTELYEKHDVTARMLKCEIFIIKLEEIK